MKQGKEAREHVEKSLQCKTQLVKGGEKLNKTLTKKVSMRK